MIATKHSFKFISNKSLDSANSESNVDVLHPQENVEHAKIEKIKTDEGNNNKKRNFLKLAGVVGVGALAATLLPKKAEALVFGSTPTSNTVGMKNSLNVRIDPATETTLSTRATEATLLNIKTGTDYLSTISSTESSIKTNTDKFTFTGSNLLVTTSGTTAVSGNVGLVDKLSNQVNPVSDDNVVYLRRIVKLLESQGVVDSSNRQRITLDSIAASLTLGTITTVTTVSTVSNITTIGSYAAAQMFSDVAKNTYSNAIRRSLTFT